MEYKTYIARKRARFKAAFGEQVNIPYGTALEVEGPFICLDGKPLCYPTSQIAYDFFSQNDDGQGLERGALVAAIKASLEKKDEGQSARWDKIWADERCQKFKQPEHEDYWIWNYNFHNAPVEDLRHIADLIGAAVK